MTQTFWDELTVELQNGVAEKDHPFRYCTMATIGLEKMPRLRTVVLRRVSKNLEFTVYTDKRSKKVIHINENNRVSLLFYHPKKLLQIKVEGLATVVKDEAILKKYWSRVHPSSRKDYTTRSAPGSDLSNPDSLEYLQGQNHFCILEIEPFKIEYLKLKRPNHLRIRFSKNDYDAWNGEFLVP